MVDDEWPWYVRAYYADDVEPPKRPGALAFETKHKTETGMRLDIEGATDRDDIDVVEYGRRHRLI